MKILMVMFFALLAQGQGDGIDSLRIKINNGASTILKTQNEATFYINNYYKKFIILFRSSHIMMGSDRQLTLFEIRDPVLGYNELHGSHIIFSLGRFKNVGRVTMDKNKRSYVNITKLDKKNNIIHASFHVFLKNEDEGEIIELVYNNLKLEYKRRGERSISNASDSLQIKINNDASIIMETQNNTTNYITDDGERLMFKFYFSYEIYNSGTQDVTIVIQNPILGYNKIKTSYMSFVEDGDISVGTFLIDRKKKNYENITRLDKKNNIIHAGFHFFLRESNYSKNEEERDVIEMTYNNLNITYKIKDVRSQ